MPRIFETKDKSGRNIYLTDERWHHIIKHSGMSSQIENIKEALLNPDKITNVSYDENVRFYYIAKHTNI